jgi:ectoine hydroxylase-related dioxygenase (phytanoyl-CoA dioxygenase family)
LTRFAGHIDANAYTHIKDIRHLTCNIAIDRADIANGCLEVVDGSHDMEVEVGKEERGITKKWEAAHSWIPVELDVGDMIFFGSYLAHRSGPNNTDKSRRALYATYHDSPEGDELRTEYYKHRRVAFPPDHERVEGADYSEGAKIYAFAAPFAPLEKVK